MKKMIALALCALLTLLPAGCGGASGQELRLNVTTSEDSVWHEAANTFKALVEERTEGRYRVRVVPDAGLTETGDLGLHAASEWERAEAKLSVLAMPWLFSGGYESVDSVLFNGPGQEAVFDLIRARGEEPLAMGENGFRQITNDVRPVTAPADLRGLAFRVPTGSLAFDLFQTLGAESTPLEWDKTLDALADGTVDGQENALDAIRSARVHLVQRYLTLWNCSYDPILLTVSSEVWNGLDDEDRAVFRSAAQEACAAQIAASRAQDARILSEISDSGVAVTQLNDAQLAAFRAAAAPLYQSWRDRIGDSLFAVFGYTFN